MHENAVIYDDTLNHDDHDDPTNYGDPANLLKFFFFNSYKKNEMLNLKIAKSV